MQGRRLTEGELQKRLRLSTRKTKRHGPRTIYYNRQPGNHCKHQWRTVIRNDMTGRKRDDCECCKVVRWTFYPHK